MANICALCGGKVSFLSGNTLICANEEELFCSACNKKLYDMDSVARGQYLLEHGNPQYPEKMRAFIEKTQAAEARKKALEPPTRPCPSCGGIMDVKLKEFKIGADGNGGVYLLGGYEQYYVDLYACPDCGKVELYTANFAAVKKREEAKAQEVTCPDCGTRHSPLSGCPRCALDQASRGGITSRNKSSSKPPWEK